MFSLFPPISLCAISSEDGGSLSSVFCWWRAFCTPAACGSTRGGYPEYQNVFFTLLLGLAVLIGWRFITEKTARSFWVRLPLYILCFAAFAALADALFTDYGAKGVTAIAALYAFRSVKWRQVLAGSIAFVWELPAPLAFLPVWFYNGQRGLKMKYFFYIFYPAHLYLLYLAARFGGLV